MKISARSDVGKVRESNQDAYAMGELSDGAVWAVVCDGMGGHAGGNIASGIAVNSISQCICSSFRSGMSFSALKNLFSSAISAANINIYDKAKADPSLKGMGTTAVVVIAFENNAYIAHAGDSRVYFADNESITQVTEDHSVVQQMVNSGTLTKEEAQISPYKNLITRALGLEENVSFDFTTVSFPDSGKLILCSDGLSNMVSDEKILSLVSDSDVHEYAHRLVDAANEAGGTDNSTVVVIAK